MGFSESSSEGRRKELRIFRWVLLGSAIAAVGMHLSSAPLLMRFVNSVFGDLDLDSIEEPIEVIAVEEEVPELETPVTPPPPSEAATENEPAASAPADSAPPLRTSESVIPTPPTAESIDTVPTESAIATETGVEGSEGAAGEADTIGLFSGAGSTDGDPTAPVGPPNVQQQEPVERQPVQEVARASPPSARRVACNPCSTPDYPLSERRENIEGQPVINVIFDANGNVVEAVIERSSGSASLDQAALEEVRANWRFNDPYGLGGQVSVEVPFVIEGSEQFEAATAAGQQEVIELPVQQSIVPVDPAATGATPSPAPNADAPPAPGSTEAGEPNAEPDAEPAATVDETFPEAPRPFNGTGPEAPVDEGSSNAEEAATDAKTTPAGAEASPSNPNGEADAENPTPAENRESAPAEPAPSNDAGAAEPSTPPASPEPQPAAEPAQPVPVPEPSVEPPPEPASPEPQP